MNNEKSAKILFAIFLMLILPQEGFNAYKQTGSFTFFIVVLVITLVLCALLLRSAFKPKTGIPDGKKYNIWGVLKVFSIIGIVGFCFALIKPKEPKYTIEIKGIKIPLDDCIEGTVKMIPELSQRKEYCTCVAEKLASSDSIFKSSAGLLRSGNMLTIIMDLKEKGQLSGIETCLLPSSNVEWTDKLKETTLEQMKEQLNVTPFAATNDIDKYCSCLTGYLFQQPANEVLSGRHLTTKEFLTTDSACKFNSLKPIP